MKILPVGTELFHVDRRANGRTDRQTHASDDSEDFQYVC